MSFSLEISAPFLERAAAEQLAASLMAQGYHITREARVNDVMIDLIAERNDHKIFYEFRSASAPAVNSALQLRAVQKAARDNAASLRVIFVRPPRAKLIEVDGIERLLENEFRERVPNQVAEIAGGTIVDEVSNVEIYSILLKHGRAEISGDANLSVTLTTGGGEPIDSLSFPMSFRAILDVAENELLESEVTELDDSVWYGDPDEFA
jgi:hypothetical protein